MSPATFHTAAPAAVDAAVSRMWAEFGAQVREQRIARRMATARLADRAGVSRTTLYTAERGEPISTEAATRIAFALGLRLELELVDPRRREPAVARVADPVHAAMGEFEARHFRRLSVPVAMDEPYQHYQFAGRADLVAWDLERRALLHIENRTRFPNLQEAAGAYNAKRAYLGASLAARLGISGWRSETHVIAALWSAEVLHTIRLRTATFRALCPDDAANFAAWWSGNPPAAGRSSALVVIDPFATGRQRVFAGLEDALTARPRVRGYADAVARLAAA